MKITACIGMSLIDVSLMYYGTVERVIEIAAANSLPLDYCFEENKEIIVPDYKERKIEDINTGIEGQSEWAWILQYGYWDEEGVWCDWEFF